MDASHLGATERDAAELKEQGAHSKSVSKDEHRIPSYFHPTVWKIEKDLGEAAQNQDDQMPNDALTKKTP